MNRRAVFDLNRRIIKDENIQNLQQIIQQMQEQHQRDMEALRQQMVQPERVFQLSADQILNKFQHIRTFTGKGDYSLQEFIGAVENVGTLCGNNALLLQHGLQMVFKEKIQGEAKVCIQRLGDNLNWKRVKAELKMQFRPRKSYKKLMDESRSIKVNNLRELFFTIRSINFQLNELYDFDESKPTNYSPDNNDKNLVDIVKDMLTGSYRVNIRNDMTLNDVFNKFDELDLLDENDVIHYNCRKNKDSRYSNMPRKEIKRDDHDRQANNYRYNNFHNDRNRTFNQQQNNVRYSSGQFRRNTNFGQNRNTYDNNRSGQHRQSFEQRRHFNNGNNFNNNSTQFRRRPNGNFNNNNNRNPDNAVPMEIDNIENGDVNFTNQPRREDCQ